MSYTCEAQLALPERELSLQPVHFPRFTGEEKGINIADWRENKETNLQWKVWMLCLEGARGAFFQGMVYLEKYS